VKTSGDDREPEEAGGGAGRSSDVATIDAAEIGVAPVADSDGLDNRQEREEKFGSGIATGAILLLPAALTVALSFSAGAFSPGTTALAAMLLAAAAGACLALARRPFLGTSFSGLTVAGALGLFAGWTLLSSHWSHAPGRALLSYDRVLVYFLTFAVFASIKRTDGRMRVLLYGLATACVVVCTASLISRTLPHVIVSRLTPDTDRLDYPLTYWNTLGLLAGVGLIFCGHLACSLKDPWPARVLGAAASPLLATTLFLTLSRGATWATVMGVIAYVLISRSPGVLLAGLATLPPTLVALITVNPPSALTTSPYAASTIARGERQAAVLLGCALAAGLLRAALLPLDGRLARFHVSPQTKRLIVLGLLMVGGIGLTAVVASGRVSHTVDEKISQFQHGGISAGSNDRLLSASSDGRVDLWRVALDALRASPLHGTGAGTYEIDWDRRRSEIFPAQDAHSLYLETLAELGWVGLLLLAVTMIGILVGVARPARGPERSLYAALFAAALAWVLAAAVDWDWQMPAVTMWLFAVGGLALAAPSGVNGRLPRLRSWMRLPALAACALLALAPVGISEAEAHANRAVHDAAAGECATADSEAARAAKALHGLPQPALVVAYCAGREHQPASAIAPLRRALASDPNDWQLWYDLAVVRFKARLPARAETLAAARLNPLDPNVQGAMIAMADSSSLAARQERTLAALLARKLHQQYALTAVTSRTPRQDRELAVVRNLTPRLLERLRGLWVIRKSALAGLTPLVP